MKIPDITSPDSRNVQALSRSNTFRIFSLEQVFLLRCAEQAPLRHKNETVTNVAIPPSKYLKISLNVTRKHEKYHSCR